MEEQASRARNIGAVSHLAYFSLSTSTGDKTDLTDKTPRKSNTREHFPVYPVGKMICNQ